MVLLRVIELSPQVKLSGAAHALLMIVMRGLLTTATADRRELTAVI